MARKSAQTLPTMDEVMAYLNAQSGTVSKRDLTRALGVKGEARVAVKNMLKELKKQGRIQTVRAGKQITLPDSLPERVVVEITGLDSMGDLIARPLEWVSPNPAPQIIITRDRLSPPAGVGDIVQAQVKSVGNRMYEGTALRRVTAGENQMVGVYENGVVSSVDRRLKQAFTLTDIPRGVQVKNKDLLLVDIPMIRTRSPEARYIKKIGSADEPFAATLISVYMHHIPVAFTESAEKQAERATVPKAGKNRVDLQAIPFVTIDGADARDFDDAVWAEPDSDRKNAGGWHLMVGIADVAWYVRTGTALDSDARLRGNSVYFPDRVFPMLPPALSNGVCSLNPNESRAAMVCEVWINRHGHKLRHTFHRALIRSARRLTYDEVQAAMDGKTPIAGLEAEIQHLVGAYEALKQARQKRGVLEIDVPERQVILDAKGQVKEIHLREQTPSMQLIEEMMILANVAAAETLEEKGAPTMYRVHDKPSVEKVENLTSFLASIGQSAKLGENPLPSDFNTVLTRADGMARDRAVNELVLRAQSQAIYSPENIGHFGLAAKYYTHFTSPIRRYPDLIVHRLLRQWLQCPKLKEAEIEPLSDKLDVIADHSSVRERAAADAERATVELKKCEYMADHIGEEYDGVISGVTAFGMFVELENGVEGLVHISSLMDDYYEFYEERYALVGTHTGHQYRLGDKVRIEVLQVNISDVSIDFIMAGENDGVREHIKQQLLAKQKPGKGYSSQRAALSAETKKKKNASAKSKGSKGAKNKEPGRRSGGKGKAKSGRKSKKKR